MSAPQFIFTLLNQTSFSLGVTAWSHISLQKCLLSSASGVRLSLCTPSNSLNNLLWFNSNNRFCLIALSNYHVFLALLQQQLTSAELIREQRQHLFFLYWTFFQALIWMPSFCNSPRLILFNCPNSWHNAFCFYKTLPRQFGCLSPVISLFL